MSYQICVFCIFAEEFNSKILTPELSPKQIEKLHMELATLYDMYFAPNSIDRIMFDEDIVMQIEGGKYLILK